MIGAVLVAAEALRLLTLPLPCTTRVERAIVLLMQEPGPDDRRRGRLRKLEGRGHRSRSWARYLSVPVCRFSERFRVDPVLAASLMRPESDFDPHAISAVGKDLGLTQIRRGITTRGYDHLTDRQLMRPWLNIFLGVRRMALARRNCEAGAPPEVWLGGYAGLQCGSTPYSRRLMYFYRRAIGLSPRLNL